MPCTRLQQSETNYLRLIDDGQNKEKCPDTRFNHWDANYLRGN